MIFTKLVRVRGGLVSSFVFENQAAVKTWIKKELPVLERTHGRLSYEVSDLPGLKIGDRCNVWGEARDVFTITGIKRYSDNRYGFLLDSGWYEEVAKCHTEFLHQEISG